MGTDDDLTEYLRVTDTVHVVTTTRDGRTIATPIWDKADALDVSRYANTPYKASLDLVKKYMVGLGQKGLPPERIGETVHTALTTPNPKTRYIVTPEPLTNWLGNNLPKRMLDNTIAKRLGLTRQF